MEAIVGLFFILVSGFIAYMLIKMLRTWMRNNASPILTAPCIVRDKRNEVWGGSNNSSTHTSYYITFEFENGVRIELSVNNNHYGLISTGDKGDLTYQGTRYKDFKRHIGD